jgi:hypothetical protein
VSAEAVELMALRFNSKEGLLLAAREGAAGCGDSVQELLGVDDHHLDLIVAHLNRSGVAGSRAVRERVVERNTRSTLARRTWWCTGEPGLFAYLVREAVCEADPAVRARVEKSLSALSRAALLHTINAVRL